MNGVERGALARLRRGSAAAGTSGAAALVVVAMVVSSGPQAGATVPSAATGTTTETPTSAPTASPTAPSPPTDVGRQPLLPNLRSRKATDVHIVGSGSQRRLRFSSSLANPGAGPLEVVPRPGARCPRGQRGVDQAIYQDADGNGRFSRATDRRRVLRPSGCMHFHPAHFHWHVEASARYWLTRAGHTTIIARHRKVSFCLRDSDRLPAGTSDAFYGACSRDRRQGINLGWTDLYQSYLPGQSLRLPRRVDADTYCLWQQADPLDALRESNEKDNVSVRAIRITRTNQVRYPPSNARCT